MATPAKGRRWPPLSILLLTWGIYLNSLGNGFHYDDTHSITENPHIRSLTHIPRFFVDPQSFSREPAMAMYRPVLLVTYAVNYALGQYRPWGYLLVNMLLHGTAALMVFLVLQGMGVSRELAWWGGMVFGLHPVHSQGVNYVSSRSEVLGVLGVLVAFYLTALGRDRKGTALVAYALALLSKSAAVVLLPLLVLREWGRERRERRWQDHVPFWGITLLYLVVITSNRFLTRSLVQDVRPYDEQICTQLKALVYYAKLVFVPVNLSVEHGFCAGGSLLEGAVLSSLLVVGSVGFLAGRGIGRRSWGSLGAGWFLAGLGLTFLVPLNVLVNEHRLYLPSIGALVGMLGYLGARRVNAGLAKPGWVLLLILGMLTWQRNRVWQDEFTLWQDAAAKAPGMFRAQSNLGLAQYERGDLEAALNTLKGALELNPRYSKTWNNLGLVYEELGRHEEAEKAYAQALDLRPDLAGTHANLGRLSLQRGEGERAAKYLRRALEIDPFSVQARVNLGLVFHRQGRVKAAVAEYEKALTLDPQFAEAYNNLGLAYQDLGREAEARQALGQAVHLRPDYEEARINLQVLQLRGEGRSRREIYARLVRNFPGRVDLWKALAEELARSRAWEEAVNAYEEALRLQPGLQGVHAGLAGAYRSLGKLDAAIAAYERGLEVEDDSLALYRNLASAYAAAGRLAEAIQACRRALEIDPGDARTAAHLEKLLAAVKRGQ